MKRNKGFIFALIILCASVSMAAFDKDKPASSTSLRNSNPEILANWSALETAMDQDHDFTTGGTQTGTHDQIKFTAPISTPSNVANVGFLYSKDVAAVVEFHWEDESGNEVQMTSAGSLGSATTNFLVNTITSSGLITANAGVTLGAGDDLIGSATSDITFNTDKFTVAGATGNTLVAGTLDVTGVATIGDASLLATSAAPSTDAMIANKKYVDDQLDFSANTTQDADAATLVVSVTYTATSDGFVYCKFNFSDADNELTITLGDGTELTQTAVNNSDFVSFTCPVASGETFLITENGTQTTNEITWRSRGPLSKPTKP